MVQASVNTVWNVFVISKFALFDIVILHTLFPSSSSQVTTEKLEELKGHIPRAGPKYRLGMYFETIHNLPRFDEIRQHEEEDTGYTSYWETDTEVDSDFGNFIFNSVHGDSASMICLEDMDLNDLRQRHEDTMAKTHPHYKLEQSCSSASSPTEHPLERSLESKHSMHSRCSGSRNATTSPPPVPPPRRPSVADPQDHTYETLDDCRDNYLVHQEVAYVSKASDNSRGSQDSGAKPVSPDEWGLNHSSRGAEGAKMKSPTCGKPRSMTLQLPKSPECLKYRQQQRKLSEGSSTLLSTSAPRKRRQEKVGSKGTNHPPPIKGFPVGVSEEYAATSGTGLSSERRSPMCSAPSPASSPSQRGFTNSTESQRTRTAVPLVIKHKGKTYFVPVVDNKLQKELEKRSRAENPSVLMKQSSSNSGSGAACRLSSGSRLNRRSFASPPKVDALDQAAPSHRRRNNSVKNLPQKAPVKQVTHYGML